MIDAQEILNAKLLRRDPMPPENMVKVRVRTSSDSFAWKGYSLSHSGNPRDTSCDDRIPVAYGVVELEMFPSHVEELRKEIAARAPKANEVDVALHDLRNHVLELAEQCGYDIGEAADVRALFRAITSGELSGKTGRHYRPSFPASFSAQNRGKELFPVASVEVVEEPKAAPAKR